MSGGFPPNGDRVNWDARWKIDKANAWWEFGLEVPSTAGPGSLSEGDLCK